MIGQFSYASEMPEWDVVLDLAWDGEGARGRVIAPKWVQLALEDKDVGVRDDDDFIGLPVALSYGILLAAMAGAQLTLSGDRSVWPSHWGPLVEREPGIWPLVTVSH